MSQFQTSVQTLVELLDAQTEKIEHYKLRVRPRGRTPPCAERAPFVVRADRAAGERKPLIS